MSELDWSALSVDPRNPNWTSPRSWGVWKVKNPGNSKRFRFGGNPVRQRELKAEFGKGEIERVKLFSTIHEAYLLCKELNKPVENSSFEETDIHNTNVLTHTNNLEPIRQWFGKRNIKTNVNPDTADTTGFFDEIALSLGNNFTVLSNVSNQIKYVQNKGYTNVKIELAAKESKEINQIISFCKALYDYSFVARYDHKKKDKVIWLTLQKAPVIKAFFNGKWMEWFILMKLLEFFREQKIAPACARSMEIKFTNV